MSVPTASSDLDLYLVCAGDDQDAQRLTNHVWSEGALPVIWRTPVREKQGVKPLLC